MTKTQFIAADPAHSVWLAAHAGTGKTKVLVDRVLRLLLQGAVPASVLCLTYTKAAAQEMQLRLRAVLAQWSVEPDEALNASLCKLLERDATTEEKRLARELLCHLLDAAQGVRIQTIHAFCQSLLARFPLEAGVAPHFTLMDDRTAYELLMEAQQALYAHAVDNKNNPELSAAMAEIVVQTGDDSFAKLMGEAVHAHVLFAQCFANAQSIDAYRNALYHGLGLEPDADAESLLQQALPHDAARIQSLREAVPLLLAGGKRMQEQAEFIRSWLESAQGIENFPAYARAFLKQDGDPMQASYLYSKSFMQEQEAMAEFLRLEQERIYSLSGQLSALRIARFSAALGVVVDGMLSGYATLKTSRALLGYDDIIHYCHRLLSQSGMCGWVMEKLDQSIQHVLLDEAQDTSPLQWDMMRLLKEELFQPDSARSLFVVGDRKQSIYSFQGADPQGFEDNREHYAQWFEESGQPFERLTLDVSFRSTAPVLKAVDATFTPEAARAGVSMAQDTHAVFRSGQAGCVELWPLLVGDKQDIPKPWEVDAPRYDEVDATQQLAEQISERIAGWLREKRALASQGRPVQAGDVMVLFQRRSPLFSVLSASLKRRGVAVAGADRIRLGKHLAVDDVLAIAQFCLLPDDDLMLATVLKTPWFGWSEEALFALAYGRGDESCWTRLQASGEVAWHEAAMQLRAMRDASQRLAPHEWLVTLLEQMGGRMACKRRFGDEVDELFDELLNQSLLFEGSHIPTLQAFVHWMRSGDDDIKRELEHGADAVRIMTVHSAKGLQGRIVILPDTVRVPRHQDVLCWQQHQGQGLCYAVPSGASVPTLIAENRQHEKALAMEEYRRLLYVAMTRAEDELYVCGSHTQEQAPEGCWYQLVSDGLASLAEVQKTEDGGLRLISEQAASPDAKVSMPLPSFNIPMPDWVEALPADEPLPPEVLRPSDPIAPHAVSSVVGGGAYQAKTRGTLTHQLLQWLPAGLRGITREHLMQMAVHFAPAGIELPLDVIVDEVWRIAQEPSFARYFGDAARAEVSLCGRLGVHAVPGQIDRLLVESQEVHIVDFKTNAQPPAQAADAPTDYVRQLAIYRALLAPVYPSHRIRCFLLWTRNASLMELTVHQMDTHKLPVVA